MIQLKNGKGTYSDHPAIHITYDENNPKEVDLICTLVAICDNGTEMGSIPNTAVIYLPENEK